MVTELDEVRQLLLIFSILTIPFAGLLAGFQRWTFSILGYSSATYTGLIVLIGVFDVGIRLFLFFNYLIVSIGSLMVFGNEAKHCKDLCCLKFGSLNERWLRVLILGSLGGLPPLLGFGIKWLGLRSISGVGILPVWGILLGFLPRRYYIILIICSVGINYLPFIRLHNFSCKMHDLFKSLIYRLNIAGGLFIIRISLWVI